MLRNRIILIAIFCLNNQGVLAGDIAGTVTSTDSADMQNCIIYIEQIQAAYSPPTSPAIMDQVNLEFRPHVLPIVVGTQVDFLNSDEVLHNVFTPHVCGGQLDLGTWPKGEKRSYIFKEEGCVSVMLCNVHPEMEAWVLVLQNPYYASVLENGSYLIADVPPGNYKIIVWHERYKNQTMSIEVPAAGTVRVDFSLSWR